MSAGEFSPKAYPPQPFSDVDWDWFCQRSADLGVPAFERERAEALFAHLSGVNAWMNLTRLRSERDYLKQHLLDSLTGLRLPELQEQTGQESPLLLSDSRKTLLLSWYLEQQTVMLSTPYPLIAGLRR